MKDIETISFTEKGAVLQQKIESYFSAQKISVRQYAKYPSKSCIPMKDSVSDFAKRAFQEADAIIFIGAIGIAVRAIAPFVQSKDKDPAVVVIDDTGKYVIPILSGHLGGANLLAENLSTHLKSEAVITTSTDRNTVFSVDSWSVKNNCFTLEIAHIKDISSEILKGHSVGFYSDFPIVGDLPKGLLMDQTASIGICVSENSSLAPFEKTLHLIPKRVVLGIGCRKGIEFRLLYPQIVSALQEHHLAMEQILLLASIDLKKEELALLQLAKKWRLPFQTYSASELNHVEGTFTASSFVESVTGVDNVCERAAWKAAISVPSDPYMAAGAFDVSAAHFIFRKITGDGVTISAVLRENWQCDFL